MSLVAADGFSQLVFHVLAHVPRTGPGALFDARHVARCEYFFSRTAQRLLTRDARTLGRLWQLSPALDVLDALPDLHTSLSAFRRTADRPLADVRPDEVASPALLLALQRHGATAELVHTMLGLLVDEFIRVHGLRIEPLLDHATRAIGPWMERLAAFVPGLAAARVELVWGLGRRGRALPGRIFVGGVDPEDEPLNAAIVAVHEHAVSTSGHLDYLRSEWSALVRGARWLRAAPAPLRDAHAHWLANLGLEPLLDDACAVGLASPADADALRCDRARRAQLFAALE